MAGWSPVVGQVSVQSSAVHGDTYAAALNSAGAQTFALQNLPSSSPVLYAHAWVNMTSHPTTATLMGLRTQATQTTSAYQVAQVYVSATGVLKVLNNVSKSSYLSNTTLSTGSWHELAFAVDETNGTIKLWLDGVAVQFSTSSGWSGVLTGQALGSVPMSNFQLGDDSVGRAYSWSADDITVSTVAP